MRDFSGKTIIVIDDNDSIIMLFTALLEAHQATVISFNRGREFLAQASGLSADLILLDIQMPDIDGYRVLDELRTMPEMTSIPVLALTAHAMSGDKENILEMGFSGYIAKPVDTRAFPGQVAQFLDC